MRLRWKRPPITTKPSSAWAASTPCSGVSTSPIPLYERALELQPGDALRRAVLGGCYLADGRTEDARAQFAQAVALDPTGDPGRYAAQELEKLGPTPGETGGEDGGEPKKKRWGLF